MALCKLANWQIGKVILEHLINNENNQNPPHHLSLISGIVTKFLFNAHSDVDGFLLNNSQQVHILPHDAEELLKSNKIGETVKIQGVKSKTVDLLFASSVICENGVVINIKHSPEKKKGLSPKA